MKRLITLFTPFLILLLLAGCGESSADKEQVQDWTQFRGPKRDGKSTETNLLKKWPEKGPKELWTTEGIGDGHSSVSISNGKIFTTGMIDSTDVLTAFDMNGKKLWQREYGKGWTNSFPGVRITPTVENNNIYVISGTGDINCINAADGSVKWKVNAYNKYKGEYKYWGIAENLLIVDNKLIYTPAGSKTTMIALDKNSGEEIWVSESLQDQTAYVSPILIEKNGKQLITNITANYFFGVDAKTGKVEWKVKYSDIHPKAHPEARIINCTIPVHKDGKIFITSGYNHTAVMFNLADDLSTVEIAWQDTTLDNHHGGVIEVDGYIYGSNWLNNAKGNWVCQEWQTGKVMYETKWNTKGSLLYADGMLYCYEERKGNLALVKTTPKGFEVVSEFKIEKGEGPHWAYPVIHNGILYIRHGNTLTTFDVRKKV